MRKKVSALVLVAILLCGCDRSGAESNIPSESTSSPINSDISSEQSSDNSENASTTGVLEYSAFPIELMDYIESLDNGDFVFVDYTFDEDREFIDPVTNWNDPWSMTVGALMETDDYKKFAADFANAEAFGRFTDKPEDFLDQDGEPMPLYKGTITDDFDNDGIDENFVLTAIAKIPDDSEEQRWHEREYLFFVDENGAVLLDDYYDAKVKAVLDYGCCKQLIVTSSGQSGNDSKSAIWGVKDGKAVKLYGGRLDYSKTDCFLYSEGQNFIGDFAVYDINKGEYLAIQGKKLTAEDIRAMDTENIISAEYGDDIVSAVLIGGKYFIINKNGVYTYENGRFERSDKNIRTSDTPGITGDPLNTLADVNYDAAVASMITPEEAKKLT